MPLRQESCLRLYFQELQVFLFVEQFVLFVFGFVFGFVLFKHLTRNARSRG